MPTNPDLSGLPFGTPVPLASRLVAKAVALAVHPGGDPHRGAQVLDRLAAGDRVAIRRALMRVDFLRSSREHHLRPVDRGADPLLGWAAEALHLVLAER